MRTTLSVRQLAVAFLSLSPAVSALAWPGFLPDVDALVVRQESDAESQTSPTPTASPTRNTNNNNDDEETEESATGRTTTTTGRNLNTATAPGAGMNTARPPDESEASGTNTRNGTRPTATKSEIFDERLPPGNVVMLTPAPTERGPFLHKIGDYVTWGWNYTNLLGTPTAIDVMITRPAVSMTWTLTTNMSFHPTGGSYTWDTKAYQSANAARPLGTDNYNLIIKDSDGSVDERPPAGYLQAFVGHKFGLYQPAAYTPLDEWVCATCSAASSEQNGRALGAAVGMCVATVLSFTWFVGGLGAIL